MKKILYLFLILISSCSDDFEHKKDYGTAVLLDTVTIGVLRQEWDERWKSDLSGTYTVEKNIQLYLDVFDAKKKKLQKTIVLGENLRDVAYLGAAYYKPNFMFLTSEADGNSTGIYNFENGTIRYIKGIRFGRISRHGRYFIANDRIYSLETGESITHISNSTPIYYDEEKQIALFNTHEQYVNWNVIKIDLNTWKKDTVIKGSRLAAELSCFGNYLIKNETVDYSISPTGYRQTFINVDRFLEGDRNFTPILKNWVLVYSSIDPQSGYYTDVLSNDYSSILTYGNFYTSSIDTISQIN